MLHLVVWFLVDVSEVFTASIIRAVNALHSTLLTKTMEEKTNKTEISVGLIGNNS
jgi:hypothetical protein